MWLLWRLESGYKEAPVAEAGIRDLRNNLSRYLDRVREGEEVVVTDRGTAIARVVPIGQPRPYDRLVAEGLIEPSREVERRATGRARRAHELRQRARRGPTSLIAYFDTSAFIPLLIDEPGSETAGRLWDEADRLVSVRLLYAEARAALAQAQRTGRITRRQLATLVTDVDDLYTQVDRLDTDDPLVRRAGDLAQEFGLRGYDAIHLAGAERLQDPELVLVAGDGPLVHAASEIGLAVART